MDVDDIECSFTKFCMDPEHREEVEEIITELQYDNVLSEHLASYADRYKKPVSLFPWLLQRLPEIERIMARRALEQQQEQ